LGALIDLHGDDTHANATVAMVLDEEELQMGS
jgi:hypothetical protein